MPRSDAIIIEAGTPLIKRYGVEVVQKIHQLRPETVVFADLKTLGTGNLEARMAGDATADVAGFSGLAPINTMEKFIEECKKVGALSLMDTLNVPDPVEVLKKLKVKPDIVELHRAIDIELYQNRDREQESEWGNIGEVRRVRENEVLVAVAGGIRVNKVEKALNAGVDILVVGRAITAAKDVTGAARGFLQRRGVEEVDQFRVMTDFQFGKIEEIKRIGCKILVAVAGGIREENAPEAIKGGADILIVGRGITNARDVEGVARRFLRLMKEEIDQYRVRTDF